jgi:hypothetical protein
VSATEPSRLRFEIFTAVTKTASSEMLRRMALVTINVSEEQIALIIRVNRFCELGTLVVASNRSRL